MSPDEPDAAPSHEAVPVEDRIADERPRHTFLWLLLSRWLLALEAWLRSHGGTPLRMGIRGFWVVVAAVGAFLLLGPVINPPLTLEDITSSASSATDEWIAREFAVEYTVDRNSDGHLAAHVTERIAAFFPDDVDERGIQRVLPTEYEGHAIAPSGITATFDGEAIDVERSSTSDQLRLTMSGESELSGDHEFVLQYDLHDLAYSTTDDISGETVDLLQWDVFGPSWPQGFAGLDVRVTIPEELDDRLIRQPRGALGWTLISAGAWLEPEDDSPPGQVTYAFTNDQNIPPHAFAHFTMPFEAGTFTMPPPSRLFLVQSFGPLAPLVFLVVTLLLALAARAVAWSDARGRPWFVMQSEPPRGVTPGAAAQILRTPRSAELGQALRSVRSASGDERRAAKIGAVRVAHRTGRLGDLPRAWRRYLTAPERRKQFSDGYRRVPRGFVRDLFIAAPLALTLLQWGIVRQLSHQALLAVVWWPVAFVLVSSLLAIIVLAIALTSRPLTRRGALVRQHLLGIGVYAERTDALDRETSTSDVLPYAVQFGSPRVAGERVEALLEAELGEGDATRGWRTADFLTWPRVLIRVLALALVAGSIVMVVLMPNPYDRAADDYATRYGDVPGTLWTTAESMDAVATLSLGDHGQAMLEVTEDLTVAFEDSGSEPPQFAQQWPNTVAGQSLGLAVTSVRVDAEEVPFVTEQDVDTLLMRTIMVDVLTGTHDVRIDYEMDAAAFAVDARSASAAPGSGGIVDRVRWTALLEGWEYDRSWGGEEGLEPLRIEFRMSDELAALATSAGWISVDTDSSETVGDWIDSVVPFGAAEDTAPPREGSDSPVNETAPSATGMTAHVLEFTPDDEYSYPFDLTVDDLGVSVDFPAGTFTGPDADALRWSQFVTLSPFIAVLGVGWLSIVLAVIGAWSGAQRRPAAFSSGGTRDLIRLLPAAGGLATLILFFWGSGDMPGDHPHFAPMILTSGAALLACVAALVLTRRSRAAGAATGR
jgi:hypothetical protein